jgi:hypothetical protein
MTAVAFKTPAPLSAAASGSPHGSPASCPGGRVRNRRERQRAARCFTGPEPVRRTRRPEPSKAVSASLASRQSDLSSIALSAGQSRRGTVESP